MGRSVIGLSALLLTACCAHGPTAPPTQTPVGPLGIYPAFVIEPRSVVDLPNGRLRVTGTSRGCAAVYVAPHVIVTSATAFPRDAQGLPYRDSAVFVLPTSDGNRLHVTKVSYLGQGDGIALLWTKEAGQPVPLADELPRNGEMLTWVGFRYEATPDLGLPRTTPDVKTVRAAPEPYNDKRTFIRFRVMTRLDDGACGGPLLDAHGRLAGVIHERHRGYMSAISAFSITEAIRDAE